jgi:hypothetical protein
MENIIVKYCIHCAEVIDPRRVKALPSTRTCVEHSTVQKKKALMQTHGTGDNVYNDIQIIEHDTATQIASVENKREVDFEGVSDKRDSVVGSTQKGHKSGEINVGDMLDMGVSLRGYES